MKDEQIEKLETLVRAGKVTKLAASTQPFGGADIMVVGKRPEAKDSFYGEPTFVVTKHYKELSWLINQLKEIFSDRIDFANKLDFYAWIADTANRSIADKGDQLDTMLLDVLITLKSIR